MRPPTLYQSHGDGSFQPGDFRTLDTNVVFEPGVLVFHPQTISLGASASILTSTHRKEGRHVPILQSDLTLAPVVLDDDRDISAYTVAASSPARVLRERPSNPPTHCP